MARQLPKDLASRSPVTDALFALRTTDVGGNTPATVRADDARVVPDDGDALFSAVLRALIVWGRVPEHAQAMEDVVMQRLNVWIDSFGPLKLDWDATAPEPSEDEKADIQKLRKIVADRLKLDSAFYDYYVHSALNARELRKVYTSLLEWPYTNPLSNEQKAAMNRQLYALGRVEAMRGTPKPIKQGIGAVRRYAANLDHPCAKECLEELQALYDAPDSRRRETQNAVVATTEMMGQVSPIILLDVIADILGVHIDVFLHDRKSGGIGSAKCVHSFGPDPQDWVEERDGSLAEEYEATGLGKTFPLLELLHAKDTKRFTYNVPSPELSREREGQRPMLDLEFDDKDALQRFYEAKLSNDGSRPDLPQLPPFKDPCKEDQDEDEDEDDESASGDSDKGDAEYVQESDASNEGEEEEGSDDAESPGAVLDDGDNEVAMQGDGVARNDPAVRARTSTAVIDSGDENEYQDASDYDDDVDEMQPSVPIRLRPFAKSNYLLREAPMSIEQEEWAKDRMRKAHDFFIEHMASRPGYGEVMLMLDPEDDAAASQYMPTGGEAAAAKDDIKKIWAWLKMLNTGTELSRQIEAGLASEIILDISSRKSEYNKYLKITKESKDEQERENAKEWNADFKLARRWRDGMHMALRLLWNVSAFYQHPDGPWVALLAWWWRLRAKAQAEDSYGRSDELITDVVQGKELCGMYSNKMSRNDWRENSKYPLWRALWAFMDRLVFWLNRNNGGAVVEKAEELSNDPGFVEGTSWETLGVRLKDRRP